MRTSHVRELLGLAAPLVLSMSTVMLLQVLDALVLGRHSEAAVAAVGPATMAVILVQGVLFGTAGYVGTFVATAHGAGDREGVLRHVRTGLRFSAWGGAAALLAAWPLGELFLHLGHAPEVARGEAVYFRILVAGSILPTVGSALNGWLTGIGRTGAAFRISLLALLVNALLAPPLALGWFGLPRLGLVGAASATLAAQAASLAATALLFRRADGFRPLPGVAARPEPMRAFLALALPQGLRISVELAAWTIFLGFVGRLGTGPLAASAIAFRINGMAFFPALGIGQAAAILVAQARGAGRDRDIRPIALQALGLAGLWMSLFALAFLFLPGTLLDLFDLESPDARSDGLTILRFVALYCLVDAANVVLASVLAALGDTRWTLRVFLVSTTVFVASLVVADHLHAGISTLWALASGFVAATAVAWVVRFSTRPEGRRSGLQ